MRGWKRSWLCALTLAAACGTGGESESQAVRARLSLAAEAGFWEAPWPIAHRARPDGTLRVADFDGARRRPLMAQLLEILEESPSGYSANAAVYLPFDGAIDTARLPATPSASIADDSLVWLVDISDGAERGRRIPVELSFKVAEESWSPAHVLVVLPFQGAVLAPNTRYAVVVQRAVGGANGRPLAPLPETVWSDTHFAALASWADEVGLPTDEIAAATVFTVGDPLAEMVRWQAQIAARPEPEVSGLERLELQEHYCVVQGQTRLPAFQKPDKPYQALGTGFFVTGADGALVVQEEDEITFTITVPRGDMPADGWPLVIYGAGAEGTARQVLDRTKIGLDPTDGGSGPPGQGPARLYGARGIAAMGFPAPLAWERNPNDNGGLTDFWNVNNLRAFRDNIRQGILDFTTLIRVAAQLRIPAELCPEATTSEDFHYDTDALFVHGHSTGSTLGSAVIALEPQLRGGILSGAGGSWIYNLVLADSPFPLREIVALLLGYRGDDAVDIFDPAITFFQTAMASIEVMNWGRVTALQPLHPERPRDLLLVSGLVDTWHYPRMVNSYAMSAGLDLVEPVVEPTAGEEYALLGRGVIPAPARANLQTSSGERVTAVTLQRDQEDTEDGHFVAFEFDDVKYRYSCFIQSIVRDGRATLPPPNSDPLAPCP